MVPKDDAIMECGGWQQGWEPSGLSTTEEGTGMGLGPRRV